MMTDVGIDRMAMNIDERHDMVARTHYRLHSRLELIEYVSVTDA